MNMKSKLRPHTQNGCGCAHSEASELQIAAHQTRVLDRPPVGHSGDPHPSAPHHEDDAAGAVSEEDALAEAARAWVGAMELGDAIARTGVADRLVAAGR